MRARAIESSSAGSWAGADGAAGGGEVRRSSVGNRVVAVVVNGADGDSARYSTGERHGEVVVVVAWSPNGVVILFDVTVDTCLLPPDSGVLRGSLGGEADRSSISG